MKVSRLIAGCTIALMGLIIPVSGQIASRAVKPKPDYKLGTRAQYLDPNLVNYIRPGIVVKIVSAAIAQDGTITARVNITDPKGVPLDRNGIASPGAVS